MSAIVIIPARMAATRLPGKPLAEIAGLPMIVHVWRRAVEANVGRVVVATDDLAIAAAIDLAGGESVMTRPDHANGTLRIHEALANLNSDADLVVNLQGDIPTVSPAAVQAALAPLAEPEVDVATICAAIRKPNRDVGVKLDRHNASIPIVLIAVDSTSGRPLCSSAAWHASIGVFPFFVAFWKNTRKWNVQSTEMPSAMLPVIIMPMSTGRPA